MLTLMAVHAHPDDEATMTGGVFAKASAEGIRTVLVTCTDGRAGDGPGGVKPGEPGHDPDAVTALRRAELDASCRVLGISDLELLGYRDSGMMGWPGNTAPGAFWGTPVDEAASRIRMQADSKPEAVDELDRRIIQLKIEREALKKESDKASKERLIHLEDELKDLESSELILRVVHEGRPVSIEYKLTTHSFSLTPVVDEMIKWGKKHSKGGL